MTDKNIEMDELYALVERTNKANPKAEDVDALHALLKKPELMNSVAGFAQRNIRLITNSKGWVPAVREIVLAEIRRMADNMGYDQAPELEKLLIDGVIQTWLRWQTWEYYYNEISNIEGTSMRQAVFWEKRLTAAHNRYLKSCESLARVRKLLRPVMQVNLAQDGGQQVNVAGDVVKW